MSWVDQPECEHFVYRCFDKDDRLLYVGCTWDVVGRLQIHASSWNNIASVGLNMRMVRHTVESFPNKIAGRAAERQAIYDEAPLFNLHHQKEKRTPASRRLLIETYMEQTKPALSADFAAQWVAIFGSSAMGGAA